MTRNYSSYSDEVRASAWYLHSARRLTNKSIAEVLGLSGPTVLKSFQESVAKGRLNPEAVLTPERRRELDEMTQRVLDGEPPWPSSNGAAATGGEPEPGDPEPVESVEPEPVHDLDPGPVDADDGAGLVPALVIKDKDGADIGTLARSVQVFADVVSDSNKQVLEAINDRVRAQAEEIAQLRADHRRELAEKEKEIMSLREEIGKQDEDIDAYRRPLLLELLRGK